MEIKDRLERSLYLIKKFEFQEKTMEEEGVREWKITIWKPASQTCMKGNCIRNIIEMLEEGENYNITEIDYRIETDITLTIREEETKSEVKLLYSTWKDKRDLREEEKKRWTMKHYGVESLEFYL